MENLNPLVSVIIPVYKVEKYLNRCIDGIINQTYKNIEIIFIDDGSPDNCGKICDEYAKKDGRIVVIHKENGGLSSARNAGMDKANGEYICFADSDDIVEDEYVRLLLESLLENGTDMSICGRNYIKGDNSTGSYIPKEMILDRAAITDNEIGCLLDARFMFQVFSKMFKRSLIMGIRFESIHYAEDTAFVYTYLSKCNSISFVSYALYNYQMMNSQLSIKYHEKMLESMKAKLDAMHLGIYSFAGERAKNVLENIIENLALELFYFSTDHYYDNLYTESCTLDDFGKEKYNSAYQYFSKYLVDIENLNCDDVALKKKTQFFSGTLKKWNCDTYFKLQRKYRKKEIFRRRMVKLKRNMKRVFKK